MTRLILLQVALSTGYGIVKRGSLLVTVHDLTEDRTNRDVEVRSPVGPSHAGSLIPMTPNPDTFILWMTKSLPNITIKLGSVHKGIEGNEEADFLH